MNEHLSALNDDMTTTATHEKLHEAIAFCWIQIEEILPSTVSITPHKKLRICPPLRRKEVANEMRRRILSTTTNS